MAKLSSTKNSKVISLFDDRSRDSGSSFNTKVEINTKYGVIVGHLMDQFKWNMSAQWKSLFQSKDSFSFVQTGFQLQGEQFFNQGVFTRKYYKGEAYIELPLKFRVTDFDGSGIVMRSSKALADSMLPLVSKINVKRVVSTVRDNSTLENAGQIIGKVASGAWQPFSSIIDAVGELGETNSDIESQLDQLEKNRAGSVLAVSVKVGNIFSNSSMVVESGSVVYSTAQVKNNEGLLVGPLYADFEVKLSSRSVRPKGQSGVNGAPSVTTNNVSINP